MESSGPAATASVARQMPISVSAAGAVAAPCGQAAFVPKSCAQNGIPDVAYLMKQRAEAQYGLSAKRTMLSMQASVLQAPKAIAAAASQGALRAKLGPLPTEPLASHVFGFALQQCMQPHLLSWSAKTSAEDEPLPETEIPWACMAAYDSGPLLNSRLWIRLLESLTQVWSWLAAYGVASAAPAQPSGSSLSSGSSTSSTTSHSHSADSSSAPDLAARISAQNPAFFMPLPAAVSAVPPSAWAGGACNPNDFLGASRGGIAGMAQPLGMSAALQHPLRSNSSNKSASSPPTPLSAAPDATWPGRALAAVFAVGWRTGQRDLGSLAAVQYAETPSRPAHAVRATLGLPCVTQGALGEGAWTRAVGQLVWLGGLWKRISPQAGAAGLIGSSCDAMDPNAAAWLCAACDLCLEWAVSCSAQLATLGSLRRDWAAAVCAEGGAVAAGMLQVLVAFLREVGGVQYNPPPHLRGRGDATGGVASDLALAQLMDAIRATQVSACSELASAAAQRGGSQPPPVWVRLATPLLKRLAAPPKGGPKGVSGMWPYLRWSLVVLLNTREGATPPPNWVEGPLSDHGMHLSDRAALALWLHPPQEAQAAVHQLHASALRPMPDLPPAVTAAAALESVLLSGVNAAHHLCPRDGSRAQSSVAVCALQAWVDTTHDVQTAALLSSLMDPAGMSQRDAELARSWSETYAEFLFRSRLFQQRAAFINHRAHVLMRYKAFRGEDLRPQQHPFYNFVGPDMSTEKGKAVAALLKCMKITRMSTLHGISELGSGTDGMLADVVATFEFPAAATGDNSNTSDGALSQKPHGNSKAAKVPADILDAARAAMYAVSPLGARAHAARLLRCLLFSPDELHPAITALGVALAQNSAQTSQTSGTGSPIATFGSSTLSERKPASGAAGGVGPSTPDAFQAAMAQKRGAKMNWRLRASAAAASARQGGQGSQLLGDANLGGGHLAPGSVAALLAAGQAGHAWKGGATVGGAPVRPSQIVMGGSAAAAASKHTAAAAMAARRRGPAGTGSARSSPSVGPRAPPSSQLGRVSPSSTSTGSVAPLAPFSRDAWLWASDSDSTTTGVHPLCPQCMQALTLPVSVANATSNVQVLHKSPPTLTVSPCCRAPLPRCALSLLPLRVINPLMQLTHNTKPPLVQGSLGGHAALGAGGDAAAAPLLSVEAVAGGGRFVGWSVVPPLLAMSTGVMATATSSDVLVPSQRTSTSLGRWWHWCSQCGHVGEGHFMDNWFAGNAVCPVSGCMCQCAKLDPTARRRAELAVAPREASASMQAVQEMEGHMRWGVLEGQRPPN